MTEVQALREELAELTRKVSELRVEVERLTTNEGVMARMIAQLARETGQ
jgi:cell division protein FtsB